MEREVKRGAAIALLLVLSACGPMTVEGGLNMAYFRDKQTGCEYVYHFNGGVTPRMNADGTQVCALSARKEPE